MVDIGILDKDISIICMHIIREYVYLFLNFRDKKVDMLKE